MKRTAFVYRVIYRAYRWAERRCQARLARLQKQHAPAIAEVTLVIARRVLGPEATVTIEHGHEYESGDPHVVFRVWNPVPDRPRRGELWEAFIEEYVRCVRELPEDWTPILSSAAARRGEAE